MGGSPVTNMFPLPPPGGSPCPPNWTPHIAGVNPCNVWPPVPPVNYPPGITTTFVNNIASGMNRFGCSFLYNRHSHLVGKLNQLKQAGTNPQWQTMLTNRISHINSLIMGNCTGGPTPGPVKPMPNTPSGGNAAPNQPMMNASGKQRVKIGPPGRTRFSQPPRPWDRGSTPTSWLSGFDGSGDPTIPPYRNVAGPERHHLKPQKKTGQITDEQKVRVSEVIGTWKN